MIKVSYKKWGKKYTENFEPGDWDAAFAYAKRLLTDGSCDSVNIEVD